MSQPRRRDFRVLARFQGLPNIPLPSNFIYILYSTLITVPKTFLRSQTLSAPFRAHSRRRGGASGARSGIRAVPKNSVCGPEEQHVARSRCLPLPLTSTAPLAPPPRAFSVPYPLPSHFHHYAPSKSRRSEKCAKKNRRARASSDDAATLRRARRGKRCVNTPFSTLLF